MNSSDQMAGHAGDGERLRKAREAAGLEVAEVARRLKMPVKVVEALENEDWGSLDAPVFVRGQLRSYARLLGLKIDEALPAASPALPIEPARLEPRVYTPPLRRAADRLMGRLVYIVITALIAVPVWMMATRTHTESRIDLDAALVQLEDQADAPERRAPAPAPEAEGPRPLVASMTSIPQRQAVARQQDAPALSLRFSGDSWIEVFDAQGEVLERGLLKAGDRRDYARGEVGRVVIGNADAVEVRRNGSIQDLSEFQRANVARFTVSSDGSIAPPRQ